MRPYVIALGACLLAAGGQTTASQAQEGVLAKSILGSIGIIPEERDPIIYRERAPLVLPPRMDLREPVSAEAVATRDPQWPNDPDVVARRRKEAEARRPVTESEIRRMSDNRPELSAAEIRAGRRAGAGIPTGPVVRRGDNSRDEHWVHPNVLKTQGRLEEKPVISDVAPERRSLTEPPGQYRVSATGKAVGRDFEPAPTGKNDAEADPRAYLRERARR